MSTMNISLPEALKAFVDRQVSERGYSTSSEYVRELIRKDQTAVAGRRQWLASLDASLERSLSDAAAGDVKDATDVLDRLHAKYAALADKRETW